MDCPCKVKGVICPKKWFNTETGESCRSTCVEWQEYQKECEKRRYTQHEEALNRGYDYAHSKKRKTRRKKHETI